MFHMAVLFFYVIYSLPVCSSWIISFQNVFYFNTEKSAEQKYLLIYPGTKWCGAGSIASDYEDLGNERETDMCCRDHDNCIDLMSAGETKHNLTNNAFYSRLHCDCDETFRTCLREANTETSKIIKEIYFKTLSTQCFKKEYPITRCKKHYGWFNARCSEYELDTDKEQFYQWFDVIYKED